METKTDRVKNIQKPGQQCSGFSVFGTAANYIALDTNNKFPQETVCCLCSIIIWADECGGPLKICRTAKKDGSNFVICHRRHHSERYI